jgi:hypothetical protein
MKILTMEIGKRKECSVKKDQIITWGGPIATFRWDDATDVALNS